MTLLHGTCKLWLLPKLRSSRYVLLLTPVATNNHFISYRVDNGEITATGTALRTNKNIVFIQKI